MTGFYNFFDKKKTLTFLDEFGLWLGVQSTGHSGGDSRGRVCGVDVGLVTCDR